MINGASVVYNECMLGILRKKKSGMHYIEVLHGSVQRGYSGPSEGSVIVAMRDVVRYASLSDFERFRVKPHNEYFIK